MSKEWFDKHYGDPLPIDEGFEEWWSEFYGPPENYSPDEDNQTEYWVRKGFALVGWRASRGRASFEE